MDTASIPTMKTRTRLGVKSGVIIAIQPNIFRVSLSSIPLVTDTAY